MTYATSAAALQSSTLYTSGEPCAMCMGAILWCRIGRLVFAASPQQPATKIDRIMISSVDVAAIATIVSSRVASWRSKLCSFVSNKYPPRECHGPGTKITPRLAMIS